MINTEDYLSPDEIDILGETFNISLGSSSTAINVMLDRKVSITAPHVNVLNVEDFHFSELEYALAVEINYVEGLIGRNLLLLKQDDIRKILEIMMMSEFDAATFEIDEIGESAVCELMNQMMGSAATAMSRFLQMPVNISTPSTIRISDESEFKSSYFKDDHVLVLVRFDIEIHDTLKSEFYNIMSIDFAEELLHFVDMSKTKTE